jgi:hypothetical protein
MEWVFQILYDKRYIKLKAQLIASDNTFELVKVIGRNRSIILRSNRPFLLSKGLRHRKVNWHLMEGTIHNDYLLQAIIGKVEDYLRMHV